MFDVELCGFWYYWKEIDDCCLHIQIENNVESDIKLVIKIDDWTPSIESLYNKLDELQSIANKHELNIIKPNRYRAGKTSTLAIVNNAFQLINNKKLDIDKFMQKLDVIERAIDEYSEKFKKCI